MFNKRSQQKELLDDPDIPFGDIKKNMQELEFINRYLGGHQITIHGLKYFLKRNNQEAFHIAEIGSGGGDNLSAIKTWANKNNSNVKLTGIDWNKECIAYAESVNTNNEIKFICSDFKTYKWETKPDVIFSSLFCHHFTDGELISMLQWMEQNSNKGFFINDLHRHTLAYFSIKMLTQLLSKSYLVKNDAPLSVLRGFTRKEWDRICTSAGIHCNIKWMWAFRWLLIHTNAE